jgi:hypothetical protein
LTNTRGVEQRLQALTLIPIFGNLMAILRKGLAKRIAG